MKPAVTMLVVAVLALSGCSATDIVVDPSPSGSTTASATPSATPTASASATPSPTPTPSATPSPTPAASEEYEPSSGTFTATIPTSWTLVRADSAGGPLAGLWDIGGSTASIAYEVRGGSPDSDYADRYGSLGPQDGVEVGRTSGGTLDGDTIMFVDVVPAAGYGGSAELTFFVYGSGEVVTGTLTYDGRPGDAVWSTFRSVASSVRFTS